jgi:hypothetical protein
VQSGIKLARDLLYIWRFLAKNGAGWRWGWKSRELGKASPKKQLF